MRINILSLAGWLIAACAGAQTPAQDEVRDRPYLRAHASTRGFMLGRPLKAIPTPDGLAVLFLRSGATSPQLSLYEFNVATGQTRELLTPARVLKGAIEKLSPEEKALRERQRVAAGGFTSFQLAPGGDRILLGLSGRLFVVARGSGEIRELATGPGPLLDPKFSPDGRWVSYVRGHDVHVYDLAANQEQAVTRGGTAQISHGLAEFVAQEEMGRFAGYWWSPDSQAIAFQESDARGVEQWFVADPARPEQPAHGFYYPRPGKANVKVRLGMVPLPGKPITWLDWDAAKYPYLGSVRWPKNGPLLLGVQTRDQKELALLAVEAGKTRVLLRETDPAWVNLRQDVPRWLGQDTGFLWVSEREGGPQLELRGANGRLRRVLLAADQGLREVLDVDCQAGVVPVLASPEATQVQLLRVPWSEGGAAVAMTREAGLHTAAFAKNHTVYVQTARLLKAMPQTTVHRANGQLIGVLPGVAKEPPWQPRLELLKVGTREKFDVALIWPQGAWGKGTRFPVLVDVYGGPHHNHVVAAQNRWLLDQWYANQGFVVVCIENRGTPGRGRDWERAIYRQFATVPLADQVAGLQLVKDHLAARGRAQEVDFERVGIFGWSFGGYMSALAVLRRPDVFKAAVAGAPVADWLDYDTHYTERYLGVPEKDDSIYRESSLLTHAAALQRPLLIVHGTADDNVYFRHSLRLADAFFRAGRTFELVPLSGLTHMVPGPTMERLHARSALFFLKHLGRPTP